MVRGSAATRDGGRPGFARALVALAGAWALSAAPAQALEFFDGRVQIHGFGEIQTRAIAQRYAEDLDLVQWYNVLSVEIETDILPDGWGPFDLMSSYVRVEGRYDCVWTRGCGTMRSADSFGDRANKLPKRLTDAKDEDFGGQIDANLNSVPPGTPYRNLHQRVSPLAIFETVQNPTCTGSQIPGQPPHFCTTNPATPTPANRPTRLVVVKRRGFPGFDTLADLEGADAILGPNNLQPFALSRTQVVTDPDDDPFKYLFEPVQGFRWTFRDKKGALGGTGRTLAMGPWLPKNFITEIGTLSDRANPFRGARTPTGNGLVAFGTQSGSRTNEPFSYRWTQLDLQTRDQFPAAIRPPCPAGDPNCVGPVLPYAFDPVDPRIARDTNGDGIFDAGQALIDRNNFSDPYPANRFVRSLWNELPRVLPFGGD